MIETGIVRRTDNMGRFVIPIEIRRAIGFDASQQLEIYIDGENLVLKKRCDSCLIEKADKLRKRSGTNR